jgi:hypothetical protein
MSAPEEAAPVDESVKLLKTVVEDVGIVKASLARLEQTCTFTRGHTDKLGQLLILGLLSFIVYAVTGKDADFCLLPFLNNSAPNSTNTSHP